MEKQSISYRLPLRDRLPRPWGRVLAFPWLTFALVLLGAIVLGQQIASPNGRIIKAFAGLLLFFTAYRAQPFYSLCFIAILFLFPFGVSVGSSTVIFIVLTTLIYLARLTLRQVPPLRGTPVDVGIGILSSAYILSMYNLVDPSTLRPAALNLFGIAGSFLLFYMTANFIRSEAQLKKFVDIMVIAVALSVFVGLFELFFPGKVLIPHYVLHTHKALEGLTQRGYRVGGPLYDYELYGEFMAISFFLVLFANRRAHNPTYRVFTAVLALTCVFMMLTTVTRGCVVAFIVGAIYLLWSVRRRIKFSDLIVILLTTVFLYLAMEFVLVNFTRSGSVMERMLGTKFVGIVPDTRVGWDKIFARAMNHPFVGHGPYYNLGLTESIGKGGLYVYSWPHNQYLYYLHTVGIVGAGSFLFILLRLFYISFRAKAPGLQEKSYAKSLLVVLNVMLVVFMVDQLKIDYLRNSIYQYYPWLLMGLVAATHRLHREQTSEG